MPIDFEGLNTRLLSRVRELCIEWLPGGKMVGVEYTCADINGRPGDSLKVNTKTGKWADFSAGLKGGDLISLYATQKSIKNGEAARELSERYNFDQPKRSSKPTPAALPPDISKPPINQPPPEFRHREFGLASAFWRYEDSVGETLFYIARFDEPGKRKQFVPYCWSRSGGWINKAYPEPRPLYNLSDLANFPTRNVMVVEGEKAADAAKSLVDPRYVVVTWPGGAQAIKKVDFSPLKGRKLLLWPDNDEPGQKAMLAVAAQLVDYCPEVKILNPTGKPPGWDAHDAVAEGLIWSTFADWARPLLNIVSPTHIDEPPVDLYPDAQADAAAEAADDDNAVFVDGSHFGMWEKIGIQLTPKMQPIVNQANVEIVLEKHPRFKDMVWFDEFHQKIFTKWGTENTRPWVDNDDIQLVSLFQRELGLTKFNKYVIADGVRQHAFNRRKNEVTDWLNNLTWDGLDRIENFFNLCFGSEDNEYTRAASRNWWISIVARALRPGCKVDNMVILEGSQGTFKSSALALVGGPWYAEVNESITSKDFFLTLHGKLIIEIGELDAFSKADANTMKKVISCQTDRFRAPYGRIAEDYPRRCVFIGSTNEHEYLKDTTGGRRYWPIAVKRVDLAMIKEHRDQLFAEAVQLFKTGANWWTMPDATAQEQEDRRQIDPWEEPIAAYLVGKTETTMEHIAMTGLKIELARLDSRYQKRIAQAMKKAGWKSHNLRRAGRQVKVWLPDTEASQLSFH